MKFLTTFALAALLTGCASRPIQTEGVLRDASDLPRAARVDGVPFVEQSAGHCGPATLAMAMGWAGRPVALERLTPQLYTPGMSGTLQADMIGAARRNGLLAIPIAGLRPLLREIAAGHPVIVFENLSVSWLPRWHYAVVHGYDLDRREVRLHSGPEEDKIWEMEKFERSWMLGDYWGLVVLTPNRQAATGGETEHAAAAAGLEQAGQISAARIAYLQVLERWPSSLIALIGMGNLSYADGDYTGAVGYLDRAARAHPESAIARNNLEVAREAAANQPSRAQPRSPSRRN